MSGQEQQRDKIDAADAAPRPDQRGDRYDWPSVALFVIFLGTFIYALLGR